MSNHWFEMKWIHRRNKLHRVIYSRKFHFEVYWWKMLIQRNYFEWKVLYCPNSKEPIGRHAMLLCKSTNSWKRTTKKTITIRFPAKSHAGIGHIADNGIQLVICSIVLCKTCRWTNEHTERSKSKERERERIGFFTWH